VADLTGAYAALKAADAAGDTEGAATLAKYLSTGGTGRYGSGAAGMMDAVEGRAIPSGSEEAQQAASPLPELKPTGVEGVDSFATFLRNSELGYGRQFAGLGLGARQMAGLASGQEATTKAEIDAPLMRTWGGNVGNIIGGAAAVAPLAMSLPATAPAAALTGAAYGVLQPSRSEGERITNTALSSLLSAGGQGATNAVGNYLTRNVPANFIAPAAASTGLTAAQQNALTSGKGMGMQATPGQETGNVALQQFEAKLSSSPWTSKPFNAIAENNQGVLNRAWTGAIGEGGPVADSVTLGNAADRLGDVFESVRDPNKVIMADPASTRGAIDEIEASVRGLLPGNASIRDNPLVQNLESLTGSGSINGEQLGQLSSKLGRAAAKQMTGPLGDRDLGQALFAVKNHVDDLLQSTLSGDESVAYGAARQQYRSLMQLTARTGNVNPSSGNVGGTTFANYLQKSDRPGFLYGRNQSDAYNALRFTQAFKPVVGNSGTATRSWTDTALAIPGNFLSRAYLGGRGPISGLVGGTVRGAVRAPGLIGGAADAFATSAAPYVQAGLPGASGALLPYITE
jgi:hypothetical protein